MVTRRLVLALLFFCVALPCEAQTTNQREPTLRDRLVAGLKVRRPSEFAYVQAVLDTVERGELSERIVDRVLFWARTRPARNKPRRPIIYFQPAMERVSRQLGVLIYANGESANS